MDFPFYGFWISDKDGYDISVTASDGIWIKNDGSVCYGDTELSLLWEQMEGNDEDDTLNVLDFPNAGHLYSYHRFFLMKVDEQSAENQEGLTMTVEDIGTSEITVRITNDSGEEFSYGENFSLQKQIDGQWYMIPVRADNIGFQDIAHILPNGISGGPRNGSGNRGGPDRGTLGGEVVFTGTPQERSERAQTITADYLRKSIG